MPEKDDVLDLIEDLIETCKDGETGYAHAAGVVTDPNLKAYFSEQSLERARCIAELSEASRRLLGERPDKSGSVAGTLHRVWFEAKADIGLGDQTILNSVEQGEDAAKKAYEKALAAELPDELRHLVQRQAKRVIAAHDHVRDLRDGNITETRERRAA